jgi:hypothetical protein
MGRRDVFLRTPVLPKGKRRPSERSWLERKKYPSSIGRHLDQFGNLRGKNSLLKAKNQRLSDVNIGREDIVFRYKPKPDFVCFLAKTQHPPEIFERAV